MVWGTGKATRDFIYVDDAADGMLLAAEKYNDPEPVNLASGKESKIKEIALMIKKYINFKGKILWDSKMPTGPKRRVVNINKAKKEFDFKVKTSMDAGIKKTIEWYKLNENKLPSDYNFMLPHSPETLFRLGIHKDGGYIVDEKIVDKTNVLVSFGMADEYSFEIDFTKKQKKIKYTFLITL